MIDWFCKQKDNINEKGGACEAHLKDALRRKIIVDKVSKIILINNNTDLKDSNF